MAAGTYNFTIEQGTTYDEEFIWRDGAGNPVDLTDYTARMQVRSTQSSATVLADLTTVNGGIVIGGGLGKFRLVQTDAQTSAYSWPIQSGMTAPVGVYDLEFVSPAGVVTRLLKGQITLDPEVTR